MMRTVTVSCSCQRRRRSLRDWLSRSTQRIRTCPFMCHEAARCIIFPGPPSASEMPPPGVRASALPRTRWRASDPALSNIRPQASHPDLACLASVFSLSLTATSTARRSSSFTCEYRPLDGKLSRSSILRRRATPCCRPPVRGRLYCRRRISRTRHCSEMSP